MSTEFPLDEPSVYTGTGHNRAIGLVVDAISPDRVLAHLTVEEHHLQPFGIVHGGVYAAIAEAIASIGAAVNAATRFPGSAVVGLDNHTTFIRATRLGTTILAEATPRQAGRRTQSWDVSMRDPEDREVAVSRVRLLVQPMGDLPHGPTG